MPGLFGVYAKTPKLQRRDLHEMCLRMSSSMRHKPWLRSEIWNGERFSAGRVYLGVLNADTQPLDVNGSLKAWFDGELFPPTSEARNTPDADSIQKLIQDGGVSLAKSDGVFSLTVYDPAQHQLTLANDHCGFQPLYYVETTDLFAYAAEVKALLAILKSAASLDENSLRQFFGYGYMLGERTWWRQISLIPPGNIWRVTGNRISKKIYWTFDAIKVDARPEEEVLEEFGQLWSRAVKRRRIAGTMPLLLSGGLDSRMLLAELCGQGADIAAITFGTADSLDMEIARRCAKVARVPHRLLPITEENWWDGREEAIWYTDGLANVRDLHVSIARNALRSGNGMTQKSIVADAIFHGKTPYLRADREAWKLDARTLLLERMNTNPFFSVDEIVDASTEDANRYIAGPTPVCYQFLQNTRRLNIYGAVTLKPYCEVVLPRAEMSLLQLILSSVPEERRAGGKFFIRFLLQRYPKYFLSIPWEKTSRGLSEPVVTKILRDFKEYGRANLGSLLMLASPTVPAIWRVAAGMRRPKGSIADYDRLFQAIHLREQLASTQLILNELLQGRVTNILRDRKHLLSTHNLATILTSETYLRQAARLPALTFGIRSDGTT